MFTMLLLRLFQCTVAQPVETASREAGSEPPMEAQVSAGPPDSRAYWVHPPWQWQQQLDAAAAYIAQCVKYLLQR
jgi:hypothetical protein